MNPRRLVLLALAASTISQGCAKRATVDSTLPVTTLTEDWILLNEPITADAVTLLGKAAYSIEDDDYYLDCYESDPITEEQSYDVIVIEKTANSSAAAFGNVLKLLGVNVDSKRISTARIQLNSVVVAKAPSTRIDRKSGGDCRCREVTEIPKYPALTQLIGADRFTFTAKNEQNAFITAELLGETPAGADFRHESKETAEFSFEDFRWIGARLVGFDLVRDEEPTQYVLALDKPEQIEIEDAPFQVRITRRDKGGYLVDRKNLSFSAEKKDKVMWEGTSHQFVGQKTPTGSVMWWTLSSVGADSVKLVLKKRGYDRVSFIGEKDREKLTQWSKR